ncbi:tagaturonate reductase [Marasmitruncus massiliensis]|uniref:tagaturonate reductase n=1 Tax=Marasmitruncus massiliensis TaxID=1944642 RepID=UPI000C7C0F98|nr:tagaturonate reductase [Marasmitruncus massiliensis]
MKTMNKDLFTAKSRPIGVMQYGEGNFLRAFADYMIDIANEKGVTDLGIAIVKPIPFGSLDRFHEQDNLYTVVLRGQMDGKVINDARVITSVQKAVDAYSEYADYMETACLDTLKIVISNTTEAGIVFDETDKLESEPPVTYPGKLTKALYARFKKFAGAADKGLVIIPCELIEHNGDKLHTCVNQFIDLWKLGDDFKKWVEESCTFCCTLVDRIVTGYPRDNVEETAKQLGYVDNLVDTAEPFGLWVIESKKDISKIFPIDKAGLPVVFTDDQTPYRERKVRILNGAHTSTVLAGYLAGFDIVGEIMKDADVRKLMETIVFEEIVPTVKLPHDEVVAFANSVFERFENPFIKHRLLDISLNSVSKWKSRILPTFRDNYNKNGAIPRLLTFSFAALMAFYSTTCEMDGGILKGDRNGERYDIKDDAAALEFFASHKGSSDEEFVKAFASHTAFWGEDLTKYTGFVSAVAAYLGDIRAKGMKAVLHGLVK